MIIDPFLEKIMDFYWYWYWMEMIAMIMFPMTSFLFQYVVETEVIHRTNEVVYVFLFVFFGR